MPMGDCEQPFLRDTLPQGTTQIIVVGCNGWGGRGTQRCRDSLFPEGGNNLFEINFLFAMSVDDFLAEL